MKLYSNLPTGKKRLIWVGFVVYLVWMFPFHGWDTVIDGFFKPMSNNLFVAILILLGLYWLSVFAILWVAEGFESD